MSHAEKDPIERSEPAAIPALRSSDLFGPACRAVGRLAGEHERLRAVLMEHEPWPLRDVLAKLVEAGDILMHEKNYDGHGWEQISHAIERGKAALSSWPNDRDEPRET